jgi:hypothetical protein
MQKNEQQNEKMKSENKQKKKSLSNAKKIAFTFSNHRCFEFLVSLL